MDGRVPIEPVVPGAPDSRRDALAVMLVVSAYIGAQMLADVASLKIGLICGAAVDMGTFIYPFTFTLRDLAHRTLGRRVVRWLVVAAAAINLLMAAYLWMAARAPSDPRWGLGAEFAAVLGPVWRIVLASIVAEVIGELIDTEAYHWFVTRVTRRRVWARVVVSNAVSMPVENLLFAFGAFHGVLPPSAVWEIFYFNLAVKFAVTLPGIPLIYLVRERAPEDA